MDTNEFRHYIEALKNASIPFSMDWGSDKLRSKEHQKMLIDHGVNVTALTLFAVDTCGCLTVFSTCDGCYMFTLNNGKYDWRTDPVTLDTDGMHFIPLIK